MSDIIKPIYLDYAASTPLDPHVLAKMRECLEQDDLFGNAASKHFYGKRALEIIENARAEIAAVLQADPSEIIFTSGATESINLGLKGAARLLQSKGKHIVTLKTEHKAVLDTCQYLEREGFQVTYLSPENNGLLDLDKFEESLRPDTIIAAISHVNNETGVIQDINSIANLTAKRGIKFLIDAAQSIGKIALSVQDTPVDLISLSAHKVYGPKGIGALYLRKKPRIRVSPLIHGGGHENGMRSGTLVTHQIVGMGEAYRLVLNNHDEINYIKKLNQIFLYGMSEISVCKKTTTAQTVPHIINLQFQGMMADAILADLPEIAASTASACALHGVGGSYVLRAMGFSDDEVKSAVRFSIGRFTTEEDMRKAVGFIQRVMKI
jgi:cysteine desulfurase